MKVQIINFKRDTSRPCNYLQVDGPELFFDWFRLSGTVNKKVKSKYCLDYWNGMRWQMITGIIPIVSIPNTYAGDIQGATAAIWISPNNENIRIAILKDHQVKRHSSRAKRIIKFLNEKRSAKPMSNTPLVRSNNNQI